MNNTEQNEYISTIGVAWIDPIIYLIDHLKTKHVGSVNEVQTSMMENGYSVAIISQTVFLLESIINRMQYFDNINRKKMRVFDFFSLKIEPIVSKEKFIELRDILDELFVIRDIIVHNHIWKINIEWDSKGIKFAKGSQIPQKPIFGGNNKFFNVLDESSRKTKLLKLNVFPTRINWTDVVIVMKSAFKILDFIEKLDRKYCYFSIERITYQNKNMTFSDFIEHLE